jgi:hypothetical protein
MSASNAWSECAAIFARTRKAHTEHEAAKSELKLLVLDRPLSLKEHMFSKPKKKRSELQEMIFEELKPRHPALEMVHLRPDCETGWRCDFVWKIDGNVPVDDIDILRSEADAELARLWRSSRGRVTERRR